MPSPLMLAHLRSRFTDTDTATSIKADTGYFALTGQDAVLNVGETLNADAGVFAVTGQDINFDVSDNFVAEAGIFSLNTETVSLKARFHIIADGGSFALHGQDAGFIEAEIIVAEAGNFTMTTGEATLIPVLTLPAATGTFALAGQNIGIGQFFRIDGVGVFTFDGQDVDLNALRARRFEYANKNTKAVLSQANANSVIVTASKNEAA